MSPEQEETLEKLRVAVLDHMSSMGWMDDGKLLSEFVVVACSETMDDERRNFYTMTQSSANMPHHHVAGLLHGALHWHYQDDGDDD